METTTGLGMETTTGLEKERIVLLTDIGDDIDDTFAIALLLSYLRRSGNKGRLAAIVATGRGHLTERKGLIKECLAFYGFCWEDEDGDSSDGEASGDVGAESSSVRLFAGARHTPEIGGRGIKSLAQLPLPLPLQATAAGCSAAAATERAQSPPAQRPRRDAESARPASPRMLVAYLAALQATNTITFINIGPSTTLAFIVHAAASLRVEEHRLIMMAASYAIGYGASTWQANEFNVRQDPPAFLDVTSAKWSRAPVIVSLDTAGKLLLRESEVLCIERNAFLTAQNSAWRKGDLVASALVSEARYSSHKHQREKESVNHVTSALYDCAAIYAYITIVETREAGGAAGGAGAGGTAAPFHFSTSRLWVTDTGFTISEDFVEERGVEEKGGGVRGKAPIATLAAIRAACAAAAAAAATSASAGSAGAVAGVSPLLESLDAAREEAMVSTEAVAGNAGGGNVIGVTRPVAITTMWNGDDVEVDIPMKPSYASTATRVKGEFLVFRDRVIELLSEAKLKY